MLLSTFLQLLPILLITAGGYFLTRIYHLSYDTLVKVIADFLIPMLMFHAFYTSDIGVGLMLSLAGATSFVVLGLLLVSFLYCRCTGVESGQFIPPVIFMNSGFLGIPLMKLWGGIAAMNMVVLYDQIQTLFIFSVGILIIAGGLTSRGFTGMVKSPILWALVAGFIFRFLNIPVHEALLNTLDFGGSAGPPLAALALGVSLGETKFHFNRHLFAALIFRFIGGYLLGWLGCELFGIAGLSRTIVIVASSLPSAVFTSILPIRFGEKADFAGTMVIVSTVLGSVLIPLSFVLASL